MEKNVKLAIIGQLMDDDILPPFDIDTFFEEHLGQSYDGYAEYNYAPIPEVEGYLAGLELDDAALSALKILDIDGDDQIYQNIWPQWDGEDDYFAFTSLDGLEQCRNLTTLDICGILSEQPLDLTNLKALPIFETLILDGAALDDVRPLLDIPTLKTVKLTNATIAPSEDNRQALDRLRERGVTVQAPL